MNRHIYALLIPLVNAVCWPAYSATVPVTINGTITAPTCSINKARDIDVDYGTLNVDEIGTARGTKTTRFPLDCAGANLKMRLYATSSSFNENYAKTSIDDLAIKFTDEDGTLIPLTAWVDIDTSNRYLDIRTTLITKNNAPIHGGGFTASASLLFEYK